MSSILDLKGLSKPKEIILVEKRDWKSTKLTYKELLSYLNNFEIDEVYKEDIEAIHMIIKNDLQRFEYNKLKTEIGNLIYNNRLVGNDRFENKQVSLSVWISKVEKPNEQ